MRKMLKSRRGEGYIDTCVLVLVFVMVIVIALNIMSFITQRQNLEVICDNLLEVATSTGAFGNEYTQMNRALMRQYPHYTVNIKASAYYSGNKVQLGDTMTVQVRSRIYLKGLGIFQIPVTVNVEKSGLSEKYWK